MSTTRQIQDSLIKNNAGGPDISELEPTRSFVFSSMPCEKFAADMRNATIASMKQKNIPDVAREYLVTRFMNKQSNMEAGFSALTIAYLFYQTYANSDLTHLIGLAWMLPIARLAINNSLIHHETTNASEQWLRERLDSADVEAIKSFSYNKQGLFKLADLLDEKGINTDNLRFEAKTTTFIEDIFCCCMRRK